jgi:hypothetical protein
MSETIEEIYHEMIAVTRQIQECNQKLDALMARAQVLVGEKVKREPVHHVASADPAEMHVLAGTLPPNILKK